VNQIEVHPYFPNDEVRAYGREHGIVAESWGPLAQGKVFSDSAIARIAQRLRRTPSQVVLRWHIQRGDIVLPKTTSTARMRENLEVFDFVLNADTMAELDALDLGETGRGGPHPDTFDEIPG
jgi:2,5-diketo-D-gluconate reductase A